jgi:hypothetical protein
MLTHDEKTYLAQVVEHELGAFRKSKKSLFIGMDKSFLKAEHQYEDFLLSLLKKLH